MSTANSTDEVDGDIMDFRTLVLAMAERTTVQARLILIVSQRSVQGCQLSQLHALEFILAFRDGSRLFDKVQISK